MVCLNESGHVAWKLTCLAKLTDKKYFDYVTDFAEIFVHELRKIPLYALFHKALSESRDMA